MKQSSSPNIVLVALVECTLFGVCVFVHCGGSIAINWDGQEKTTDSVAVRCTEFSPLEY